jgi:eukaryotic-like serine/threonine-protein kinase
VSPGAAPERLFFDFQAALAGRYSVERELGRGGMGIVYCARDLRLERVVAIKLLPPAHAKAAVARERFVREARTAAQLSHPNIIPIHAVEEIGDFVFFVMAFVDGETLGARVRRDGPLKPHDAARILREVAWALAYAHGQGVIHRDVKPDNILLERGGRALVADFGIARLVEASSASGGGELVGTPEYMSPEQASGGALDGRSDLYSLGVVGYYALSGRLPFTATSVPALLAQHVTKACPPLTAPGVPQALVSAVEGCLAKDPAQRPQSGEQLATVLGTALDARRDLPVPVRAFLTEIRGQGQLQYLAPFIGAAVLVPAGLHVLLDAVFAGNPPAVFRAGTIAIGAILLAAAIASPAVVSVRSLRRLLRAGYRHDDLVRGLELEVERRREEQEFAGGAGPSRWERLMRSKMYASLGLVALTSVAAFVVPYPAVLVVFGLFGLSSAVAVVTGIAAFEASRARLQSPDKRRLKFWKGRLGRWLFKLAGIGLKRGPAALSADRPTEVALGLAAVELFEALPKETRQQLGNLTAVVRGLEERVRRLRGNGQEARLGEALAALEVIRFDLLRLHGGLGTVNGLTADLGAAQQISERVDALLEGRREVDDALP